MKVYQFDLRVVVPDDATESELLERVRTAAEELTADTLGDRSVDQAQAKAVLVGVEPCGTDPQDCLAWDKQACEAITKADAMDWFFDARTVGHDDGGAG